MTEESEEACLVNPKSPLNGGMQYTDGVNPSTIATVTQSQSTQSVNQAQSTNAHQRALETTINSYDINDDIILSQFHADAIKQVISSITTTYEIHFCLLFNKKKSINVLNSIGWLRKISISCHNYCWIRTCRPCDTSVLDILYTAIC